MGRGYGSLAAVVDRVMGRSYPHWHTKVDKVADTVPVTVTKKSLFGLMDPF